MIFSYSSLNTYLNCPRQFEGVYKTKQYRSLPSAASDHGVMVHGQMEKYLREGGPVPTYAPKDKFLQVLRGLKATPERPMAITRDGTPTGFWDEDAMLRGKLDVWVEMKGDVLIVDWKTGKPRDNTLQAQVYSAFAQAHAPGKPCMVVFDYLDKGRNAPIIGDRKDFQRVKQLVETVEAAEVFAPRPSGLCRFCPVLSCPHHQEPRR